jgi:hypothetical protein
MKKTLFVLFLLSTTAAFAQYYGGSAATISSQVQPYQPPSHPAQATYAPLSTERSVLGGTSYTSAQGERPASDFPQVEGISLGAYAREFRKQHALWRKSKVVWVNQ